MVDSLVYAGRLMANMCSLGAKTTLLQFGHLLNVRLLPGATVMTRG